MTAADLELLEGERLMSTSDELVYRQVTQHLLDGDKLSTTAFGPTTADRGMPSFSRSSVHTAQQARDWHTEHAKSRSLGVWAVTVSEVVEAGRHVIDDSATPVPDGEARPPGHCFVDYRGLTKPQERELRSKLYFFATDRGEIPTAEMPADGKLIA